MFKRLYSRLIMATTRFLLSLLLHKSDAKLRKKNSFKEIANFMERLESNLVINNQLNEDLTEGPVLGRTKSSRTLINAFVTHREMKEDENFYIQVARDWASILTRKRHRRALICIILFLIFYLGGIFFHHYISGWSGFVWLTVLFLAPLIGMFSAILGNGWKKWILLLGNLFLFSVFLMIVA